MLLHLAGRARFFGRCLGLLFKFHAFQPQHVFRALDGILQGAVSVVEQRALLQAPFLLPRIPAGVEIGMQLAAEFIESSFQSPDIDYQLRGKLKNVK